MKLPLLLPLIFLIVFAFTTHTTLPPSFPNYTWPPLRHIARRSHIPPSPPGTYICLTTATSPLVSDVKSAMLSLLKTDSTCRYLLAGPGQCLVMSREKTAALGICADVSQAEVRCYWDVFKALRVVVNSCAVGGRVGGFVKFMVTTGGVNGEVVVAVWESELYKAN